MHHSHIERLRDVLPYLKHAEWSRTPMDIGGATFDNETALALKLAALDVLRRHDAMQAAHGEPITTPTPSKG